MAPELFADDGVYSFYSDMWALGCVLYELATGKPPFAATGLKDLIQEIAEKETPVVEGFSPLFNDLIKRLLEKDPVKRIYWEHLRKHPFWAKEINQRKIPRQPQFDTYLQEHRGIDPEEFHDQQMKHAYFIPNIQYKAMRKIDPMRVSQSISKNMLKEMNKDAYGGDKNVKDITLVNRDQEILMGLDNDDMAVDKESMKKVKEDNLKTIDKDEIVDIKENKTSG
jgi:serine/threonine-protein kinase ULK4